MYSPHSIALLMKIDILIFTCFVTVIVTSLTPFSGGLTGYDEPLISCLYLAKFAEKITSVILMDSPSDPDSNSNRGNQM